MKFSALFASMLVLAATSAAAQMAPMSMATPLPGEPMAAPTSFPNKPTALVICAGNNPPENMVITAAGTSYTCPGSCRSRQVEPVEGPIMVICAGQPIPQYYETESVTTTPTCNCIADQDNAYVIRRMASAPSPTPTEAANPLSGGASGEFPSAPSQRRQ